MRSLLRVFWPGFLLTLCVLTFGGRLAAYLPDPVPLRFDAEGHPMDFASPAAVLFLLPSITVAALAVFALFWQRYSHRGIRAGALMGLSLSLLLNGVQVGLLLTSLKPSRSGLLNFALASLAIAGIGALISLKLSARTSRHNK